MFIMLIFVLLFFFYAIRAYFVSERVLFQVV